MKQSSFLLALSLALASGVEAQPAPVPTEVRVHVVSRDAKLIGTGVGGVWVAIRDATTGRTLAEGLHQGGTGDTRRIVQLPRLRDSTLFTTEGAAGFTASVTLERPTAVVVSAYGPLGFPDQAVTASKQLLLVPGEHLRGDGVVLELHGLIVELLAPAAPMVPSTAAIPVRARVRMLCGCPTGPDQLWSAGTVHARLLREGQVVAEATLGPAGEASLYTGTITAPSPGAYVLEILASDAARGNAGMVRREVVVYR